MSFVVIKKDEFESFLPEGFSVVDNPASKEIIYDTPTKNPNIKIRIYSSVDIRTNDTRDIGKDAIRCVLVDKYGKPIDKSKRTHRMSNWRERLQIKLELLYEEVDSVVLCKTCDSQMILRNGTNGQFYGCNRYPLCTTTKNSNGRYQEKLQNTSKSEKFVECPFCGAQMIRRNGRHGEFYGCSKYPNCKGTRQTRDVDIYSQGVKEQESEQQESEQHQNANGINTAITDVVKHDMLNKQYDDIPDDDDNVELIDTKDFPHLNFKFEKFNPVQSRVFEYYDQDINLIVAAATSAGKTAIAEMFMSNSIANGKKAVFLSPLKAVSQEKYEDWTDESHDWSKLNVSIVTGDYQLTEARVKELNAANVIIMTTEMMDSRTRRIHAEKNDWLLDVGTVVMDESHLITMKGRGDKCESAIMRFTKQNPHCKIVFLSATMPNVSELAEWLSSLNDKKTELINSNYRPCKLNIHHERYNDFGRYQERESNKMKGAIEITQQHPNDKFIIFVHAKAIGRSIYSYLKDNLDEKVELHNADLELAERIRVSNSFKSKDGIRIIVATSTLAWGINLPARRVIVVGVHRGLNEVEPLDIKQEAGRAGRVGFDPEGDAYILLPDSKFMHYKQWCKDIPPIISTMNNQDVLAFHIVSEISEGEVRDIESLMDWYNRSLAAFQSNFLDRVEAESLLNKLEKIRIIEKHGKYYRITRLGRIAAHLYFSPYSIAGWYFNFNRVFQEDIGKEDVAISWALANIQENMENYVPKDLATSVADYKMRCNYKGLVANDVLAFIGFCYECCLTYSDAISPVQKRNLQYDIERVISALEMIDNRYASWGKGNYWKRLEMRIRYEITWEQTQLCSLKGIGGVFVRKLFDAGIESISSFKYKENKDKIVGILGSKKYIKIMTVNHLSES